MIWALSALGMAVLAGLFVATLFGAWWGLALLLCLFAAISAYQIHNLVALVEWTRRPVGTPVPSAYGLWDFIFSDLNRRTRAGLDQRQQLVASLDQFRAASQAMPDGVMFLADDDSIEWVNQRAEQQFGLDTARDAGTPVTNLLRQPEFVEYLLARRYAEPLLLHSSRAAGMTLLVQIIPFGTGRRMVLARDITQLEKLETMRRDFVANVSHELRTPLTVVSGFIETLREGAGEYERDEIAHFLDLAAEQADRMQRLIADLLSLSALETGAPQPRDEFFPLRDLLEQVYREATLLSSGRHTIRLQMAVDSALRASRKEIHSAFNNLAINAVRYTPDGGEITLEWIVLPDGGGEFSVSDNGIGIEAEHLPRLTERFYRVDRGRSRESGGTGLGLAIVKHVLTRHQAELLISSKPGVGSRFAARFPAGRLTAGSVSGASSPR